MEPGLPQYGPLIQRDCDSGIHGFAAHPSQAASDVSPSRRTPCLKTDHPLGPTPFCSKCRAYDSTAHAKSYRRANGLFGAAHSERRDCRCRLHARAGLWPEARANAKGCRGWSNGKLPSKKVGIAELITCVDGLGDDAEAVANGCSLTWSNGMVEGFVNKVKWIKRSSYGQAGFPLREPPCLVPFNPEIHIGQRSQAT